MPKRNKAVNGESKISRRSYLKAAGVASVASFAGCTSEDGASTSGSSSEVIELDMWEYMAGGDGEVLNKIIDRFNSAHDNIQVSNERVPWGEYFNRLFTVAGSGDAPDVAMNYYDYVGAYGEIFTPLDDYISDGTEDAYADEIMLRAKGDDPDGDIHGLPLDASSMEVFYNVDMFEEAGLDHPISGFEEFQNACDVLAEEHDLETPFIGGSAFVPGVMVRTYHSFLTQVGESMYNDDLTGPGFNNDNGMDVAEFWYEWTGDRGWDEPTASGDARGIESFLAGDCAMVVMGSWQVFSTFNEGGEWNTDDPNWDVMRLDNIMPGAENNGVWSHGNMVVLPEGADRTEAETEAAVEFAEWITQRPGTDGLESQTIWGREAGHLPAAERLLESDELMDSFLGDNVLSVLRSYREDGALNGLPQADVPHYQASVWNWVRDIYTHNSEPEEAVQGGAEAVREAIESN